MTREHAIFLLFKKRWMNVIAMFKENGGICYYVNIATPTLLDQGYLKYIDYDLDVKLYPDMVERTLDEKEFERHVLTYGYPPDLTAAIRKSKDEVQAMIANKEFPFVDGVIRALYQKFQDENKAVITPKA
jgi:protein associated with RNAse G/E